MNSKQLAEMVKTLRKLKMEQIGSGGSYKGSGADIQDPASPNRKPGKMSKEIHHGVVKEDELEEHQMRAMYKTHAYVGTKLASNRKKYREKVSQPKGARAASRYRLSEKKETSSNNKSTLINTTPEQDSAMIGTQ